MTKFRNNILKPERVDVQHLCPLFGSLVWTWKIYSHKVPSHWSSQQFPLFLPESTAGEVGVFPLLSNAASSVKTPPTEGFDLTPNWPEREIYGLCVQWCTQLSQSCLQSFIIHINPLDKRKEKNCPVQWGRNSLGCYVLPLSGKRL